MIKIKKGKGQYKISLNVPSFKKIKFKKGKTRLSIHSVLVFVLVLLGIIGWVNTRGAINTIDTKIAAAEELARPADLEIIRITDKNCTDCSVLDQYIDYMKTQNVNVVSDRNINIDSPEAQNIISKYSVAKVPFFMVTGELEKHAELSQLWSSWGTVNQNVFIQSVFTPPYIDVSSNDVMGLVKITYITDDSCEECVDITTNKNTLEKNYGVKVVTENTIDVSSDEGSELVEKYSITKVPVFLLSSDVAVYQNILAVWNSVGTIESDGSYLFRNVDQLGTYYDLETKQLVNPSSNENDN